MAATVRVQLGAALAERREESTAPAVRRRLAHAARAALRQQGHASAEISVTLLDDAEIAAMNSRFLGHAGATDVISFALYADGEDPVGDVYIGFDQAQLQAAHNEIDLEEELIRLTVHGVLHVLGFDHPEGVERLDSEMWRVQEAIVADVMNA